MLEKVSTILKIADESNTAVISFICTDYNMVYSVVTTAEKTNTPPWECFFRNIMKKIIQ